MNRNSFRVFRGHLLREVTAAWLVAGLLLQSATAVAPDWWSTRGVLAPGVAADDYAVANQGQLKNLAKQAALEMNAKLSGGAGPEINALITAWSTPTPQTDDYAAVNQGQLKNVAAPFYERLAVAQLSPLVVYPWSQGLAADDYALANTGQLKAVFALQMPPQTLAGGFITLPPALLAAALQVWNALPVKPVGSSADDFDGDGIANLQEYRMGSPLIDPADIDGDRIPDSIEAAHPGILSQTRFADAVEDYDQDGVMNFEEILLGLDLASATTSTRTDGLDDATVLAWSLLGGGPLVPGTDAVRACWEGIDADWIDFHASGNEHWLVRTDADNDQIPDGLAAFRTEFWGPAAIWRAAVDDCDGDAMPDVWEYRYAFDLRDWQDAYDDPDDDEVSNLDEFTHGTHPRLADTDGDGYADNLEIQAGSLPTVPDSTPAQLPLELYTTGGWSQSALPGTALPQPLSVQATRGGIPWPGVLVKFAAAEGQLEAPAVVTQADGRAQLSYTTAAHPTLWQLTLTASAGAVQTTFAVTVTDVDTDSDGWADRLEQQYGSSPTNVAATPATQNPAVVSQERRYDIDSLRADDSWVWGEGYYPSPSGSVRKFGVSHYWNYLGDTGWTADVQLTPPQSRPVRFYPLEQALLTEAPWQPVIRRATWQLSPLSVWNWNDPTTTGHLPLRSAPYHPAIPACNRFDYTETPLGLEQGATGWGVAWNRVRLSLPGPLPQDYQENYLQVTYKSEWDGVQWPAPPPSVVEATPVQLTLRKGQTEGDWHYITPMTLANERLFVVLLPIELKACKRGTIQAPGAVITGNEVVNIENADLDQFDHEGGARALTPADIANGALQDASKNRAGQKLTAAALQFDDDLVKFYCDGSAIPTGSKLTVEFELVPLSGTKAIAVNQIFFYTKDGDHVDVSTLKLTNAEIPTSGPMHDLFDKDRGLFAEIGDLGTASNSQEQTERDYFKECTVRLKIGNNTGTDGIKLKRGGFWIYDRTSDNGLSFHDGIVEFKTSGEVDKSDDGVVLFGPYAVKSGQGFCGDDTKRNIGPTPAGWWMLTERLWPSDSDPNAGSPFNWNADAGKWKRTAMCQRDRTKFPYPLTSAKAVLGKDRSPKIYQGGYSLWDVAGHFEAGQRIYDPTTDGATSPTSTHFKFDLNQLQPSQTKRDNIQIHPDGHNDGTAGCIGLQNYQDAIRVNWLLKHFRATPIDVRRAPSNSFNAPTN